MCEIRDVEGDLVFAILGTISTVRVTFARDATRSNCARGGTHSRRDTFPMKAADVLGDDHRSSIIARRATRAAVPSFSTVIKSIVLTDFITQPALVASSRR